MRKVISRFKVTERQLPKQVANLALNLFKDTFRDQGFYDSYLKPWQPRKFNDKKKSKRGLLIKSGALRRSIIIKQATFKAIRVGSYSLPYASIHNQGLMGTAWGKYPFKMPKRQFIGKSKLLNRLIKKKIKQHLKKLFS